MQTNCWRPFKRADEKANNKKTRKDKQNQITKPNINYDQNSMSFFFQKKTLNKIKLASNKD